MKFGKQIVFIFTIGHHVFRHKFGQDPKQENEAESYADQILVNRNRLLFRIIRLLKN